MVMKARTLAPGTRGSGYVPHQERQPWEKKATELPFSFIFYIVTGI